MYFNAKNRSSQVFSLQILLPFIFLIFGVLEVTLSDFDSSNYKAELGYLANVIFFNTTHVAFTFYFFSRNKDLLQWIKSKNIQKKIPLQINWLFLFMIFFSAQYLTYDTYIWPMTVLITTIYTLHHSVWQHYGIFKLQHTKLSDSLEKKTSKMIKLLFSVILIMSGLNISIDLFKTELPLIANNANQIKYLLVVISFISILIASYYTVKKKFSSSKVISILFLLRMALYPLAMFSYIGSIGIGAVHGYEYYKISQELIPTSNSKNKNSSHFILASGTVFLLFVFVNALSSPYSGLIAILEMPELVLNSKYYNISWMIILAISYLHYYIDRQLFSISDPDVQRFVLPQLKESSSR